jgi:NTP pyrophosphatase (non-canonical NTP hydrolase)
MNMLEYLTASGRTSAGNPHNEKVNPGYLRHWLGHFTLASAALDQVKKCLFYNRDNLLYTHRTNYGPASVDDIPADELHAILGIMTEAGELGELLQAAVVTGDPIDRAKLIDESGDILWYLALLFRRLGTTFEEVGEKNIAKLLIRFPEKFTDELVNNKDHEAEAAVFFTTGDQLRFAFEDSGIEEMTPVIQRGSYDV